MALLLGDEAALVELLDVRDPLLVAGEDLLLRQRDHGVEERHRRSTGQSPAPRRHEERVGNVEELYDRGLITEEERHEPIVNLWTEATEDVAQAMEKKLRELNPIFMMANSGARGSFKQIRQLAACAA